MKTKVVPIEIREKLLKELGVQPGKAVVRRQRSSTSKGDEIVVIAYPGSSLSASDIPDEYHGYPVHFERHLAIPQAG